MVYYSDVEKNDVVPSKVFKSNFKNIFSFLNQLTLVLNVLNILRVMHNMQRSAYKNTQWPIQIFRKIH